MEVTGRIILGIPQMRIRSVNSSDQMAASKERLRVGAGNKDSKKLDMVFGPVLGITSQVGPARKRWCRKRRDARRIRCGSRGCRS